MNHPTRGLTGTTRIMTTGGKDGSCMKAIGTTTTIATAKATATTMTIETTMSIATTTIVTRPGNQCLERPARWPAYSEIARNWISGVPA